MRMNRWIQGTKGKTIGLLLVLTLLTGAVVAPQHTIEAANTLGTAIGTIAGLLVTAAVAVTLSVTVGPQIGIPAALATCIALCPNPQSDNGENTPPPRPLCELTVSPETLNNPQRVVVSWDVQNAREFHIDMDGETLWSGDADNDRQDSRRVGAVNNDDLRTEGSGEVLVENTADFELVATRGGQSCRVEETVWLPPQGCEATFDASATSGGDYELSWNITNRPQSVQVRSGGETVYAGNDASHSITVSDTAEYTITATNPAGSCTAAVTAGVPDSPTVTLEGRNVTENGDWTSSNFSVITGQIVNLRWDSPTANSCSKSFVAGSATASDGEQPSPDPDADGETYTIECENENPDEGRDSITITANDQPPTLTATPEVGLRIGDTFDLEWNLNGNEPSLCEFTSGAEAPSQGTLSSQTEVTLTAQGATTYTLTCAGGTDSLDIEVRPQIFES